MSKTYYATCIVCSQETDFLVEYTGVHSNVSQYCLGVVCPVCWDSFTKEMLAQEWWVDGDTVHSPEGFYRKRNLRRRRSMSEIVEEHEYNSCDDRSNAEKAAIDIDDCMGLRAARCNGCEMAKLQWELKDKFLMLEGVIYELDAEPVAGQELLEFNGRPIRFHLFGESYKHSDECYHWNPPKENNDESVANSALVPVAQGANYNLQPAGQYAPKVRPAEVIARAQEQAKALMDIVEQQNLFAVIQGKKYLTVEAWQLLAAFNGLSIVIEDTKRIKDDEGGSGWEARSVIYNVNGKEVGAGEAQCMNNESKATWRKADDYARRSMAQTRAVSKSCRTILSFVVVLAGYEPTPYEEMAGVDQAVATDALNQAKITTSQHKVIKLLASKKRIANYLKGKGYSSLKDVTYHEAQGIIKQLKATDDD